jgi:histidyl-tRNA synthetase
MFFGFQISKEAFLLAELREQGFKSDFDLNCRNFKRQFEKASKLNAKYAFILGEEELKNSAVTVKDLGSSEQKLIERKDMLNFLNQV